MNKLARILSMNKDYCPLLQAAHTAATCNREQIERSDKCGCFFCCSIFSAHEVPSYVSTEEPTAECPCCITDSVIGDASGLPLTEEFLEAMREWWF